MPMTEQQVRRFLAHFQEASDDIENWPQWMQDAAREAAATFPRTPGGDEFQPPPQCRGTLCKTKGVCQYACGVPIPLNDQPKEN